ncbi:TIGR03013 family XrtA/PEP-CTERM system glycosyltransferase [Aliikangiella sp. IMCC44359]|uniref:TIGR03013 family XrtA/PEP-CTERM system glycosyltransferase n=1 Tax=Aliikangiella sp. IMCC44359 TaxID=3459125 RepID=UPI00403B1357
MATVKIFNHHFRTPFIFLLVFEFLVLFVSVYIGAYLRFEQLVWQPPQENLMNFPLRALIFSLAMLFGMIAMGQYQIPGPLGKYYLPAITVRVFISFALGLLGLVILYYLMPDILLGRGIFAYSLSVSLGIIILVRLIFLHTVDGRSLRRKILVYGAGELAENLIDDTDPARALVPKNASYVIHGFVPVSEDNISVPEQYLVKPGDDLAEYCSAYEIDEVVLAIADRRKKMPVDSLLDCKLSNINVIDFVGFWEREKSMIRLDMMNPSWMIFCEGCKQGTIGSFFGRLFDILISFVLLVVMLPFLIVTAILIFIESGFKGPIFYRQTRVGLNGKNFELLKFRSMVVNAEKDGSPQWAAKNDMRITRVGSFIRKVRIDELPQILNIFNGDMSLVGPRPERPEFVSELEQKIPFYSTRHRVKPGLAGWAQLKYPYGASEQDTYNKLQYDLYYVKNHSLIMDVLVLLQTVEVIVLGKGAR